MSYLIPHLTLFLAQADPTSPTITTAADTAAASSMLATTDWLIIAAYFVVVFAIALYVTFAKRTQDNSANYFLAGRNAGWLVIGASLFASNIGSEHLVGLAGSGHASGIAVAQFELIACLMLMLLGWVFAPFYMRSGVYTMPEFLERRFGPVARGYLAGISIVAYVLTKISVTIFAGAIVFDTLMGIPFWTGALIVVVATGVYTVIGGLRAVLYTDLMQAVILIGGAILLTVLGLQELGGWGEMTRIVSEQIEQTDSARLSLWKDPAFPPVAILLGMPILGVWYWCTDQFIVQRVLAAKNLDQARRGTVLAGYLKLLPLFIFVIPGVIAFCLQQQGKITITDSNTTLPILVGNVLPLGLRGIVVAGLLAALMSSLSSVFNSCSTLITWDLYKKLNPTASERHLVSVGQIATGILVVLGLLWIPSMQYIAGGQLYTYLQEVQAYISPPIAAVFLLGVFWSRVNNAGALTALFTGFILGAARLFLNLYRESLTEGSLLHDYATMNFLILAVWMFVVAAVLMVIVSLLTPKPSAAQIVNLTFQTTPKGDGSEPQSKSPITVALSIGLIAAVLVIWFVFR